MTPQLHLINFPDAETFFKPEFLARVNGIDRADHHALIVDAVDAIKSEHLIFKGKTWCTVLVAIHKLSDTPTKSHLHDDLRHGNGVIEGETGLARPAVNWTLNDKRVVNFWSNDNVAKINTERMTEFSHPIVRYSTTVEAEQSYTTNAGDVYLMNAGSPHQATSYNDSISISIRSADLELSTWDENVVLFTDEII